MLLVVITVNNWLITGYQQIVTVTAFIFVSSGSYGICYCGVETAAGRPDREEPGEQKPSKTTAEEVSTPPLTFAPTL